MIEVVNGCVVGSMDARHYYRFYSRKDGRLLWDAGKFDSLEHAEAAFLSKFQVDPYLLAQYKSEGVETRDYDGI